MLNVRVKKALLTILTACLTVLMTIGAILGFTPTTQTAKAATSDEVAATWTLVKNVSDLAAGDKVIIVANASNYALGPQSSNGNNRKQVAVTKSGSNVTFTSTDVQTLTLQAGTASGSFAFYTGSNYLCAASSSSNYLKTEAKISANSSWKISITSAGVATITAQGNYTRKVMQYNQSSSLFACYSSASQKAVSIYKMVVNTCKHTNTEDVKLNDTTHKVVCADCDTVITASVKCTTNNWSEWTPSQNAGKHTRTGNCVCGNTLTETADCKIESASISNNDGTHSNTGTCSVCGDETTAIIDCSYTETDNTYSVTYTCESCDYSYIVNKYTVEFSVPDGVVFEVETQYVLPGTALSNLNDFTPSAPEGYTFAGWVTKQALSTTCPDLFTAETEIDGNVKLYALYKSEGGGITQVKSTDELADGDKVIIAAQATADQGGKLYALSTNQRSNNREGVEFDPANILNSIEILTLKALDDGKYAFYDEDLAGYLYAAATNSNYLKTKKELDVNGKWNIDFNDDVASIIATDSTYRNVMLFNYNNNNPILFSCYAAADPDKYSSPLLYKVADSTYTTFQFASANLTLGKELVMNYKVAMDEKFADAEMTFTMTDSKGNTIVETTVAGEKEGNVYVYSIAIAPQYMGANIAAELKLGDTVLASKANYSVKEYAESLINDEKSTNEVKQLASDLLLYGAAAQAHTGHDTEHLVADLSNLGDIPEESDNFSLSPNNTDAAVSFKSAGVNFSSNNTLYIKLNDSLTGNIKLYVNNVEATLNGNVYYTEGLKATQFDDEFIFELRDGETVIQTLKYSVNAYAYALQNSTNVNMANLARALYNYGVSAEAYVATLGN